MPAFRLSRQSLSRLKLCLAEHDFPLVVGHLAAALLLRQDFHTTLYGGTGRHDVVPSFEVSLAALISPPRDERGIGDPA